MQVINSFHYKNKNLRIKSLRDNNESHHTLGAFFSGTDVSTLREEGNDRTHFVSLIIDTRGKYVAAITRVVEEEMEAIGKVKYKTFKGEVANNPIKYTYTKKKMEYFMLDVTRPTYDNPFYELDERIKEVNIQKAKQAAAKAKLQQNTGVNLQGYGNGYRMEPSKTAAPTVQLSSGVSYQTNVGRGNVIPINNPTYINPIVQSELPFEMEEIDDTPVAYGITTVNPELLESLAKQLVSGTIAIADESSMKLEELSKVMEELYARRFADIGLFKAWAGSYVEFIVYFAEDSDIPVGDDDELAAIVAYDLSERLKELPQNEYIKIFINMLHSYII